MVIAGINKQSGVKQYWTGRGWSALEWNAKEYRSESVAKKALARMQKSGSDEPVKDAVVEVA